MNERREAETSAATANRSGYRRRRVGVRDTAREFDFRFPLRHHHEKRTFGIGTLPISPGAIAGDEGVANELLRIDLPTAARSAFRHAQWQGQIADLQWLVALIGKYDRPRELAAIELERFFTLKRFVGVGGDRILDRIFRSPGFVDDRNFTRHLPRGISGRFILNRNIA